MERIGLFGGSFDPIDIAHLILAQLFVEKFELNKCYFIPTNISPFKTGTNKSHIENIHRLNMVKLAIMHNNKFLPEPFEINRSSISYTFDTLVHFKNKYPDSEFYLLIGTDQAEKFHLWHNREKILSIAKICIADRFKHPTKYQKEKLILKLSSDKNSPLWLDNPIIELSSTIIREKIKKGESIKYLVTSDVEEYIKKNNLYK